MCLSTAAPCPRVLVCSPEFRTIILASWRRIGRYRSAHTEEAESGMDTAFYESVILINYVIEIFASA